MLAHVLYDGDDRVARAGVRRMKLAASAALFVAALTYVLTVWLTNGHGWAGYLAAAAEAAMVGGIADWFAVTALFRRPLGLPIPHTGLVPRKKDELATKLGEFVTSHFVTADTVAVQLTEARIVERIGRQLSDVDVARRLSGRVADVLVDATSSLSGETVTDYAVELARRDLSRRSYAPFLGRLLASAVESKSQEPLVDILARHARLYLTDNREFVERHLNRIARQHGFRTRLVLSPKRIGRLLDTVVRQLEQVEGDPDNWLRQAANSLLTNVADDLEHEPATAATVDATLQRLVDDPQVHALLSTFAGDLLETARTGLTDPDSTIRERMVRILRDLGERAVSDPRFQAAREEELRRIAVYAVTNYGDTVVRLIQRTVAGWEGRDAARRIETAVGRDLQFIRINGTVVGGLAGLVIHALTVLA
jgi:uncharacterized membrane-anchored protein YjiN (DUF445 family)